MTKEYPWGKGSIKTVVDTTANDSDKSYTVPDGKVWDMRYVLSQLSTTATVGNRVLTHTITDGVNHIANPLVTSSVAATQHGGIRQTFGVAVASSTTVFPRFDSVGNNLNVGMTRGDPPLLLAAGSVIRVYDQGAIDAAADDLTVILQYVEYDA